jgi:hypothetical protein
MTTPNMDSPTPPAPALEVVEKLNEAADHEPRMIDGHLAVVVTSDFLRQAATLIETLQAENERRAPGSNEKGASDAYATWWNFYARQYPHATWSAGQWKEIAFKAGWSARADATGTEATWKARALAAEAALETQGKEIERLRAEAEVAAVKHDWLCDSNYAAGLKAGWNYCVADDDAGLNRAIEGRVVGHRAGVRAAEAKLSSLAEGPDRNTRTQPPIRVTPTALGGGHDD